MPLTSIAPRDTALHAPHIRADGTPHPVNAPHESVVPNALSPY